MSSLPGLAGRARFIFPGVLEMAVASSAYKKALEGNQQPKEVLVKIDRQDFIIVNGN